MAEQMRLLQMMAGAERGGAELFFERLARGLSEKVDQSLLIRDNPARAARLPAPPSALFTARFGGRLDLGTRRRVRQVLARVNPDIVLTWMTRATRFCPRGDFVHIARLGGYYPLRHYRHCDHLIGNTPDLVAYFRREGWPEARTHYVPNFVDARRADRVAARSALGLDDGDVIVAALGRLHPNKAFDVLITAMARLVKQVPEAVLLLAGDGPLRADLTALADQLGVLRRVRFLGWQQDSAPIFAAADVIAVPSRHEPLGNVVLEAWAQHRPLVAAASQGPGFLIEDGATGLLCPIDDDAALATALTRAATDLALADQLVQAGAQRFKAEFDETAVVRRYCNLFDRLLKEAGGR